MKHVDNLTGNSKDIDVIVKGKITGMSISTEDKVLYKIETDEFDKFEADECCVYHDVTKPVVVEQFVADWYEKYKGNLEYNIWDWMRYIDEPEKLENIEFTKWLGNSENNPVETLVSMKLFGYEVKEKKYIIKLKNVKKGSESFKFDRVVGKWYFGMESDSIATRLYHTRKELEDAGFGDVFNSQLFEVEEVK